METVEPLLTGFLKQEIAGASCAAAVVGLSGGVDSAVVAALCARALGPDNVLAVLLPHRQSSPDSISDAETMVRLLGVRSERVDISPMVDPFLERNPDMSAVRRGNVMARMRMIVLFDRSAREGALVVGTGNKTELLLGYSTLHGDAAYAINPIGNLYKSQVWELARHLGIPERIIGKAPSADLWAGQTDEAELGVTYRQADELLYHLVDAGCDPGALPAMGFDPALVERMLLLVGRSRFKRLPATMAQLGPQAGMRDVRWPHEWGM